MGYTPPVDYAPCPRCGCEFGMGLSSRNGYGFVQHMDCGMEGPHIKIDFEHPTAHDRPAIEGWNAMRSNGQHNARQTARTEE